MNMIRPFFHQPSNYALVLLLFALLAYSMIGFTIQADLAAEAQPASAARSADLDTFLAEDETASAEPIQGFSQRTYTSGASASLAP
jgi:hypothetical protein